jgi:hypothetical protein
MEVAILPVLADGRGGGRALHTYLFFMAKRINLWIMSTTLMDKCIWSEYSRMQTVIQSSPELPAVEWTLNTVSKDAPSYSQVRTCQHQELDKRF